MITGLTSEQSRNDEEGGQKMSGALRPSSSFERAAVPGVATDFFQWLPEDVRVAVAKAATVRKVGAGGFVFLHGDSGRAMYRILEGTVRLSLMRADGQQMIYALFGPGECIAASSIIDEHPLPQTAEALDEVHLQVIGASAFTQLRSAHRAFDDALLRLFARRIRVLSTQVGAARLADLSSQVVIRLLELAKQDASGRLLAKVNHTQLAMFVGVSRQSIHRVLKTLAGQDLIGLRYGAIELRNLPALKAKAQFV